MIYLQLIDVKKKYLSFMTILGNYYIIKWQINYNRIEFVVHTASIKFEALLMDIFIEMKP